MSADLFAEFGSLGSGSTSSQPVQSSQSQSQSQPQPKPAANTPASDPFACLFSPASQTASPQTFQSPQQWPSIPYQQEQGNAPGNGNGWGTLGSLGMNTVAPPQQQQQQQQQQHYQPSTQGQGGGEDDDDDGWGDFEEAPSATSTKPKPSILSGNGNLSFSAVGPKTAPEPPTRTRIQRAPTLDLMSNKLVALDGPKKPEPWQDKPSWQKPPVFKSPAYGSGLPAQASRVSRPMTAPKPAVATPKNVNADVLFDADDFGDVPPEEDENEEEDDFGDFATVEEETHAPVTAPKAAPTAMADLLSLDLGPPASQPAPGASLADAPSSNRKQPPAQLLSTLNIGSSSSLSPTPLYPQAPRSPSFSDRNPFPGLAVTTPVSGTFPQELKDDDKEQSPTPITAWPEAHSAKDKGDYFDAFADFPPDASSATATPGESGVSSSWDWDAVDAPKADPPRRSSKTSQRKASSQEVVGPPPANVPPPFILLSIFPDLLEEADAKLYKPTSNQAPGVKSRIYADPATLGYLKGYLTMSTVAARILAGRKLRWNRDRLLSQGMKISAAGSKGGMKLAGVDKAQTAREDREAADVVGVWRDHLGKLRGAVAAANVGVKEQPVKWATMKVPDINDHMAVTTVKVVPTAPRPCVICGLKRDERVKGVDLEVEDSFGEWWVDHWGHRACRNFWLGNEEKLRSR